MNLFVDLLDLNGSLMKLPVGFFQGFYQSGKFSVTFTCLPGILTVKPLAETALVIIDLDFQLRQVLQKDLIDRSFEEQIPRA